MRDRDLNQLLNAINKGDTVEATRLVNVQKNAWRDFPVEIDPFCPVSFMNAVLEFQKMVLDYAHTVGGHKRKIKVLLIFDEA